jgi:hypothetical protein
MWRIKKKKKKKKKRAILLKRVALRSEPICFCQIVQEVILQAEPKLEDLFKKTGIRGHE